MDWNWVIVAGVAILYVHIFNAIAKLYLESNRTLTLKDLWRRWVPPTDIHIQI
jgi:hypothetical protein